MSFYPDVVCNICGHEGSFTNEHAKKEGFHCVNCTSTSRNRSVVYTLGKLLGHSSTLYIWPADKTVRILELCPRGPQTVFFREKFDYYEPEYEPSKIESGADPRDYSNIEDLQFEDNTFDFVIASDVFEHVRFDKKGFEQILRVLKPEGTFIFTSPFDYNRERTLVRVNYDNTPILEKVYHGGGGATLEYREYGRDVIDLLAKTGFSVGYMYLDIPGYAIYPYGIFICRKSSCIDLTNFTKNDIVEISSVGWLLFNRLFAWYKWNLLSFFQYVKEAKRKVFGI